MIHPQIISAATMARHNDRLASASEYHRFTTRQENETIHIQHDSRFVTSLISLAQNLKTNTLLILRR
jgi:hypothetical protein